MSREDNTYYGKAYRFVSFDAFLKTIQTKSLRLTRVDGLNDPLDTSVYFAVGKFFWSFAFNDRHRKEIKDIVFGKLLSNFYIACFSKIYKKKESYLMWAYYAKGHSQLCFEIDFKRHPLLKGPLNVNYVDSLVHTRNKVKSNKELIPILLSSKSSVWKHEQEVRLLYFDSPKKHSERVFSDDNRFIFLPFNPNIISKVIFGVLSNKENEVKIINEFINIGHTPIFEKMSINPMTLKLEAKKYTLKLSQLKKSEL